MTDLNKARTCPISAARFKPQLHPTKCTPWRNVQNKSNSSNYQVLRLLAADKKCSYLKERSQRSSCRRTRCRVEMSASPSRRECRTPTWAGTRPRFAEFGGPHHHLGRWNALKTFWHRFVESGRWIGPIRCRKRRIFRGRSIFWRWNKTPGGREWNRVGLEFRLIRPSKIFSSF